MTLSKNILNLFLTFFVVALLIGCSPSSRSQRYNHPNDNNPNVSKTNGKPNLQKDTTDEEKDIVDQDLEDNNDEFEDGTPKTKEERG